ncbi:NnrU family protein [Cribrihabitans pelagius]|uniref:NnrU family protein n=1 Tax=Cribrihabitans pelagius TaxID=1765746 RepID=UPI003B59CBF0
MALLIAGLVLWWGAHLFKRLAPGPRAAMGNAGRGAVALVLLVSVVLMVLGYRSAEVYDLAAPPPFLRHINNLMVLIAIYLMSPAPRKGALLSGMRHPMLAGVKLWAVAHLLVNWDAASFVLFGGLLAWAVTEVIVINRAEPEWSPRPKGSLAKDGMFLAASVVLYGVIGYIHGLIGPSPFPG